MFGTIQDITDRKRAEDKIREQEAELRQIVDLAPRLVTVFGPAANAFMPTVFCSTTSTLVLMSGARELIAVSSFIPMTGNVWTLILILPCLAALLTSWSSECARAAETIAGFSLVSVQCAMIRDRSYGGMLRLPTSKTANAPRKRFSKANSISQKGSALPAWEVGHSILLVVLSTGLRSCSGFMA